MGTPTDHIALAEQLRADSDQIIDSLHFNPDQDWNARVRMAELSTQAALVEATLAVASRLANLENTLINITRPAPRNHR